jgi:anti-sigma B factor antagonist
VTVPLADLTFSSDGDVVVASVRGEIDMSNAGEIGEAIGRQLSNEAHALVFDLTACEYLDSAAIHLIYELHTQLRNRGQDIRVVIAPGALIGEALRLADVPRAVGATETVEAALTSLRDR